MILIFLPFLFLRLPNGFFESAISFKLLISFMHVMVALLCHSELVYEGLNLPLVSNLLAFFYLPFCRA